jgi:wyosine [tRNA(Phe)-imidazoG37] synthetase (radical SAM superfamily)
MAGFLFHETIFGPIKSRRLGISLGINLLPNDFKICTFDCIYCECGWTKESVPMNYQYVDSKEVKRLLENVLIDFSQRSKPINNITFAGNGEPTLHPEFIQIINDTIKLRDKYFPSTKITVLSNSTTLRDNSVIEALKKIDNKIMKLDAGSEEMYQLINQSLSNISLSEIVHNLQSFNGNLTIQTLFLRGNVNEKIIDNTTDFEVNLWLNHLKIIKPNSVMIYPIERDTPDSNIEKIGSEELNVIAEKVRNIGIKTDVY